MVSLDQVLWICVVLFSCMYVQHEQGKAFGLDVCIPYMYLCVYTDATDDHNLIDYELVVIAMFVKLFKQCN